MLIEIIIIIIIRGGVTMTSTLFLFIRPFLPIIIIIIDQLVFPLFRRRWWHHSHGLARHAFHVAFARC
jgi:hypothetical protein